MKIISLLFLTTMFSTLVYGEEVVFVSRADGLTVSKADVEADIERLRADLRQNLLAKPENLRRVSLNLYLRKALAREAESLGMDKDPIIATRLRLARDKVLSDARIQLADGAPPDVEILEKQAQAEYNANPERYRHPEEVKISHILIGKYRADGRKLAEDLLEKIKSGKDVFEKVALKFSDDPGSKAKQGDLGYNPRGKMVKPFDDAAWALSRVGELSGVVETEFGWHILRLDDKRAAGIKPFAEVKEELVRNAGIRTVDGRRALVTGPIEQSAIFNESVIEAYSAGFRTKQP